MQEVFSRLVYLLFVCVSQKSKSHHRRRQVKVSNFSSFSRGSVSWMERRTPLLNYFRGNWSQWHLGHDNYKVINIKKHCIFVNLAVVAMNKLTIWKLFTIGWLLSLESINGTESGEKNIDCLENCKKVSPEENHLRAGDGVGKGDDDIQGLDNFHKDAREQEREVMTRRRKERRRRQRKRRKKSQKGRKRKRGEHGGGRRRRRKKHLREEEEPFEREEIKKRERMRRRRRLYEEQKEFQRWEMETCIITIIIIIFCIVIIHHLLLDGFMRSSWSAWYISIRWRRREAASRLLQEPAAREAVKELWRGLLARSSLLWLVMIAGELYLDSLQAFWQYEFDNMPMIVNISRDEGWEEIYVAMHAQNQGEGFNFFEVPTLTTKMLTQFWWSWF